METQRRHKRRSASSDWARRYLAARFPSSSLCSGFVLFPTNRVRVLLGYFLVRVPAVLVIGFWAVLQFMNGFGSITTSTSSGGGVAYFAHIGGFIAGFIMALALKPFAARGIASPSVGFGPRRFG